MANRADQRKYHYIYKITRNDGSGKYYIGMHSTDDLEDGYFGSGQQLWRSIHKHGKEIHSKEILEHLPSREALKLRERELVNEEIVNDPKCMNLRLGGEGWSAGEASKVAVIGNKSPKRFTEEYKQKLSESSKKAHAEGRMTGWTTRDGMLGKKHSSTSKAKMSSSQTGSANSQFGTCWVCNEAGPMKIKKDELDNYLANGYRRGRK